MSDFEFEKVKTIKGYPELHWTGKRPYRGTDYYPAQLKEKYGEIKDDWINKIFWGDNLQVMSHMLKEYRGKIDLIYIDPPFDSKADYKKTIKLKGQKIQNDNNSFEEKQYGDIWTNDEYLQFMYERIILLKELLSDKGTIYLHCDYHKNYLLRCILDEIFGVNNFKAEIIWQYSWGMRTEECWNKKHDVIFMYSKGDKITFNANEVLEERKMSEATKNRLKYAGALIKDGNKRGNSELALPSDVWYIATINGMASERENYPTQKPEELIEKIIKASSNKGDIVFDCFMGSGTTQAVAMKLGRKFIGADINLGAVQTTTKRLLKIKAENLEENNYTGFEIYNVNNYDFFRNPLEAKDLLIDALGIQKFDSGNVYDGELDGRMVKIMPINRITTKADLEELKSNLPYQKFEKRKQENPLNPVESITLVCMGHENDLKASLENDLSDYKIDIEVYDILRDKKELQFKRDSEAIIKRENQKIVIEEFYPMNLLSKLKNQGETIEDWRQLVESVVIDWNYDGAVMEPQLVDIPAKDELVNGIYEIPANAKNIKIKITDLLSESFEKEIKYDE